MSGENEARQETGTRADALLGMLHAGWMSHAICAAVELGIPDRLAGGPRDVEHLAHDMACQAQALERLVRALTSLGLLTRQDDGRYRLTPAGELLCADAPGTVRSWVLWWSRQIGPLWGELAYSVRTGESARSRITGAKGFEALERNPELATLFNRAMVELTAASVPGVARCYDFSGRARIVDVGGGHGALLIAVLAAWPGATGVIFDRPHAAAGARELIARARLGARCAFVAGDFLESVPAGGDAYLLKSVLDDWGDAEACAILENCRRAMRPEAVLLVIEPLMPERMAEEEAHRALARADLMLLVAHGAGPRTEAGMRRLLERAGFAVGRVLPTPKAYCIMEASPARE